MIGARVLLVDDEEAFVDTLAKRLKARGLIVQTCGTGADALSVVEDHEFDVIVLDLAMPGMDGIETLKHLHEIDADLQVVLLTGHGSIDKGVEAIKEGAVDFLQKPANLDELMKLIDEAGTRRTLLIAKRNEKQISDILEEKGW